jgi:hypothetical protein
MTTDKSPLLQEIESILRNDPARMFSREEILNMLSPAKRESEIEQLLAELEVASSTKEGSVSDVYATCRGGTVYYKWSRPV